jgi:hypothetical protein
MPSDTLNTKAISHSQHNPAGDWGYPVNKSNRTKWPDYVNAIERLDAIVGDPSGGYGGSATVEDGSLFAETSMPPHPAVVADVVLVDGRFRVAAALKALWHINDASVVLIHDWTKRKEKYGRVLAYYDVVDKVDTLIVLARKSDVDWNAAAADLNTYANVPSRRA